MLVPEPDPELLATEYARARARIRSVVLDHPGPTATVVVPACPDWTVDDLLAHLAGVAADLVERRNPTGDLQAWVDGHVEQRRGRTAVALLDEWDAVGPRFEDLIRAKPAGFGGLLYDVIAHEHDLRHALGRPGARDEAGVDAALSLAIRLLSADLARHQLPAVRVEAGERTWQAGDGEPGLILRTDTPFEALRLLGSRRSAAQVRAASWEGDLDRFLPALAHMPLPAADLVE